MTFPFKHGSFLGDNVGFQGCISPNQIGSQVICWKGCWWIFGRVDPWASWTGCWRLTWVTLRTEGNIWRQMSHHCPLISSPQNIFKAMFFFLNLVKVFGGGDGSTNDYSSCWLGSNSPLESQRIYGFDHILYPYKKSYVYTGFPQKTQALSKVSPAFFTVQWYLWR